MATDPAQVRTSSADDHLLGGVTGPALFTLARIDVVNRYHAARSP
jgi:hypothetical protein